jgi:Fe-S oxidoreductase
MCCGAGGGNYWYKVQGQKKVSSLRIEQALETGAKKLAVACPFCMPMLQDALSGTDKSGQMEIKDVAELISENLVE